MPCACKRAALPVRKQVLGQALLPATALLEAAAAAAATMLDIPGTAPAAALNPALLGAAIPAPMRVDAGAAGVLETSIACSPHASPAGVTVRSLRGGSAQPTVHLTAHAAACHKLPMVAGAAAGECQGEPTSVALAAVFSATGARERPQGGAAAAPSALGSLATEGPAHQEGSGFRAHPAASDACLHLGASLGVARQAGSAGVRVPAALQAALAPGRCAAGSAAWAALGCVEPMAGGGALSSYAVSAAQHPGSSLTLCGLRAMPMQAAAPTAQQRASSQLLAGMQYALEWRAVLASNANAPGARARPRRPLTAVWLLQPADGAPAALAQAVSGQALQHVHVGSLAAMQSYKQAGAVLTGTAASLAMVQRIVAAAGQAHTSKGLAMPSTAPGVAHKVQLFTTCGAPFGPGMPGTEPAGAAALAVSILRVAAQEQPGVRWEAVSVSAATSTSAALAAQRAITAAGHRADAFGAALSQGKLLRPQMLRRHSKGFAEGSAEAPCPALGGSVLVTGGLGGLGALAVSWLALQGPEPRAPHVWLVGRSARPAHLLASSCAVSATTCDVGARGEVTALLQTLILSGTRTPALSGLLHAGGALEDAALPDQALGALRRVAAPKLAGAACLAAATAATPLAAAALFSSTSALLGPPGQANYAAANAALGAAAEAQQAAGGLWPSFLDVQLVLGPAWSLVSMLCMRHW